MSTRKWVKTSIKFTNIAKILQTSSIRSVDSILCKHANNNAQIRTKKKQKKTLSLWGKKIRNLLYHYGLSTFYSFTFRWIFSLHLSALLFGLNKMKSNSLVTETKRWKIFWSIAEKYWSKTIAMIMRNYWPRFSSMVVLSVRKKKDQFKWLKCEVYIVDWPMLEDTQCFELPNKLSVTTF